MAAAVQMTRASPPCLQAMHATNGHHPPLSMTHPFPPIPPHMVDKKHFLNLGFPPQQNLPLPSLPLLPPPPPLPSPQAMYDDDDFEEDVDEDEISDFEEELHRELMACRSVQRQQQQHQQRQPNMTQQLLCFADMVNADIQKFFGRKKGDEDSCDIYEDKWMVTKSGRELYYADLLRIAQGDHGEAKASKDAAHGSKTGRDAPEDNRNSFSGKADLSLGLGPLKDLFEYGLKHNLQENKQSHPESRPVPSSSRMTEVRESGFSNVVPMHQRRLPASFWREPCLAGLADSRAEPSTSGGAGLLGAAKLPDFSDLVESWHGDQHSHHPAHHSHHLPHHHLHHQHAHQPCTPSAGERGSSPDSSDSLVHHHL